MNKGLAKILKTPRKRRGPSDLEERMMRRLERCSIWKPDREHRFHPERKWRFDFAWPEHKLAVECEGGSWVSGGHNTGSGFNANLEKYNQATVMGWAILRYTGNNMDSVVQDIQSLLNRRVEK